MNLQARLKYWQRRLRLRDWDIEASWAPHQEKEGTNEIVEENKQSTILIDSGLEPDKAEIALVHELLHIPFEFARGKGKLSDCLLEQAIEQVAKALVGP